MASVQDKIANSVGSLSSKTDDLWGLLMHGSKAYIDKETRADDRQAAGVEDLVYANGYATPLQQNAAGGINPLLIGGAIAAVVVVALVLRRR